MTTSSVEQTNSVDMVSTYYSWTNYSEVTLFYCRFH